VAAGLADNNPTPVIVRFVVVAVVTIVAVYIFNGDRGVPLAVLIFVAFVTGMEYVVKRTASAVTSSPSAAARRRRDGPASASTG